MKTRLYTGSVCHWWLQRLTAVIMLPLFMWFLYCLLGNFLSDRGQLVSDSLFADPIKILFFLVLLFLALYHAVLGMQVVFEDYIQCSCIKIIFSLIVKVLAIVTFIGCLFAVFLSYQITG